LELFAQRVQQRAHEIGSATYVVPNLSYGYAPVSGLIPRLTERGIKVIIGAKVGSTESYDNKDVVASELFKGHRTEIMRDQPVMIVVDGTQHLVARDTDNTAARYPDAYQGYLNQVIALNDAMGFTDQDYSEAGKTPEDMDRLRETSEFQVLVEKYRRRFEEHPPANPRPYSFHFWNTAGMDRIIRSYRAKNDAVSPLDPETLDGPAIIFCNVGVLHEQIPTEIRDACPALEHLPAYFDDSGKIIDFEFGYDRFGVRYLNRLETELRRLLGVEESDGVSEFIRRLTGGAIPRSRSA
jgi:hypothetical protein